MYSSTPYRNSLPPQKIATALKSEKWRKQSVDAIINMSSQTTTNNRSSKYDKQVNYNLYNSIFKDSDFNYVLNPYGLQGQYAKVATKMKNYNIVRPKIELLKGEEMKRPFSYRVRATSGEVVSQRQDEKRKAILEHLQGAIIDQEAEPLDSIEKYFKTEYIHPREVTSNQILEYGIQKERLITKFNEGFEHALISSEEVYYIGNHSGEPKVRVVNPINFEYDKTIELRSIEEAQWAKEERWLAVGEIIDLYSEFLTKNEIDRLDKGEVGSSGRQDYYPGFAYNMNDLEGTNVDTGTQAGSSYGGNKTGSHVYVANVCWKSLRKIGFLTYVDPRTGKEEETIVSEDFKMTPELAALGAVIRWQYINEVWEGTKIGDDIYVNIRPLSNQFRDMNNPGECKLPYIGHVYNAVNAVSTSLVDLIKPHQYTYMIIWWRLEQELAKAKGKKYAMDYAKLPKSMGMDMDEWMYHFDNTGIVWYNSMEEGRKGDTDSISQAQAMGDIDMSLSQVVGQYLQVLRELEDQVDRITGISRQREADVKSSETVGGVERAIQQSTHITEPWFFYHNSVKEKVLNAYVYNFRQSSTENRKIQYIVNDVEASILEIDGSDYDDTNYNVFVTDSIKDHAIKQKLEGLAQIALQQEKTKFSDIINIYRSESITEISSSIIASEREFDTNMAEQAKLEAERLEAAKDAQRLHDMNIRNKEDIQKQLDREAKVEVAIIGALGFSQDTDMNANGIPDVIEQGKFALDQGREAFSQFIDQNKLNADIQKQKSEFEIKKEDNKIKREKIASDERIAKANNVTALKNKVVGEKRSKVKK
jgi:hypothetical protein